MSYYSASPSLGSFSDEILLKILGFMDSKDRFTMSQMSSRFNSLVHSCTSWDLDINGDCRNNLARFSSAVKIIKSLKMVHEFDHLYLDHDYDWLDEDDFYSFLKDHPEIKFLNLSEANAQTLGYIGYFCTDLKQFRTSLYMNSRTDFRVGFNNIDTLDLNIQHDCLEREGDNIWFIIRNLSALPKLRVLTLDGPALEEEIIDYTGIITKMETLETLALPSASGKIASKIIKACSKSLTSLFIANIKDADIYVLLDNCPNLTTVSLNGGCNISHTGYSALFKKLGRSLEFLDIIGSISNENEENENNSTFSEQDLEKLINSNPTKLTALTLQLNYKDHISSEGFIKLVRRHGKQLKFFDMSESHGLDNALLSAVVQNCPLVVQQGIWELGDWKIPSADLSGFLTDCGSCVKIIAVPKTCTDKNLDELAATCPKLHALDLSKCCHVSDEGLARFLENCKGLQTLDISDTELNETFIQETYPNLMINSFHEVWMDVWANSGFFSPFVVAGTLRMPGEEEEDQRTS